MLTTLNLVVVGHTNVGKTSLLRALIRDSKFGEVSDTPGTTRHVESIKLTLNQEKAIVFYDTPGLEDSVALYDYINQLTENSNNLDGIDKLSIFLQSPEADELFNQEAKVIRQLLKSDAALYVIDVREPILPKYHDELAILSYSDNPVIAILNFTSKEQTNEQEWKKLLSRLGIHAIIRFDAVFPPIDGEERLYQSLALLIEPAKKILDDWLKQLIERRKSRNKAANFIIAETLFDVTAYYEMAKVDDNTAISRMQEKIRLREQKAIDDLLKLYKFDSEQETEDNLPLAKGRYDTDLFSVEALKLMGIQLSKGLVSGAAIGFGIDLVAGGLTLGSGTLIGAAVGGMTQAFKYYGKKINSHFSGYNKLSLDDAIICFLSLRLIYLKKSLSHRSHANTAPIRLTQLDKKDWQKGVLPKSLKAARSYSDWSTLNGGDRKVEQKKQSIIKHIAKELS